MKSKLNSRHLWLTLFMVTGLLFITVSGTSAAGTFTVAWDPNREHDLAGYVIYYSSGALFEWIADIHVDELADPQNPTYTVTEIAEDGRYYIAITAFDDAGAESERSREVCVELSGASVSACPAGGGSGGAGGGGCFVSSAANGFSLLCVLGLLSLLSLLSLLPRLNPLIFR